MSMAARIGRGRGLTIRGDSPMRALSCIQASISVAVLVCAAGCQTTPKEPPAPAAIPVADLRPVNPVSTLHLGAGRYPNLFSPESRALWVNEDVAQAKLDREVAATGEVSPMLAADGAAIAQNYYVIEMQLGSQFPDASIAYDVVGLRTIDVYLLLPDGTRVWPVQRVMGSHASESNAGALKAYGRTNIVAFPKMDVLTGLPTIPGDASGVQLVLDGFSSAFNFEWAFVPAVDTPPAEPAEGGGLKFSDLFESLRELSRMTQ